MNGLALTDGIIVPTVIGTLHSTSSLAVRLEQQLVLPLNAAETSRRAVGADLGAAMESSR